MISSAIALIWRGFENLVFGAHETDSTVLAGEPGLPSDAGCKSQMSAFFVIETKEGLVVRGFAEDGLRSVQLVRDKGSIDCTFTIERSDSVWYWSAKSWLELRGLASNAVNTTEVDWEDAAFANYFFRECERYEK